VIEREYSIPDIPNPWTHKVQLTTTEVGAFIALYATTLNGMTIDRMSLLRMGVEFTPIRETIRISKNHYAVLTMLSEGPPSINLVSHWSWNKEKVKETEEYITGLFIPAVFTETTMTKVIALFNKKDANENVDE